MRYHPVVLALLVVVFAGWNVALGQALEKDVIPASPRIVQPIDEGKLARLSGNTHPLARREFDRGIVAPNLSMERMLLLLRRSPEQEAALEAFMARQLDPQSPDFHHWLEPVEFGSIYGPAEADIVAVTNWLQNQGFTVDKVSNGHMFIEFSGTAALVQRAFHTEIHHYDVKVRGAYRQQLRSEHSRGAQPGRRWRRLATRFLCQTNASLSGLRPPRQHDWQVDS